MDACIGFHSVVASYCLRGRKKQASRRKLYKLYSGATPSYVDGATGQWWHTSGPLRLGCGVASSNAEFRLPRGLRRHRAVVLSPEPLHLPFLLLEPFVPPGRLNDRLCHRHACARGKEGEFSVEEFRRRLPANVDVGSVHKKENIIKRPRRGALLLPEMSAEAEVP